MAMNPVPSPFKKIPPGATSATVGIKPIPGVTAPQPNAIFRGPGASATAAVPFTPVGGVAGGDLRGGTIQPPPFRPGDWQGSNPTGDGGLPSRWHAWGGNPPVFGNGGEINGPGSTSGGTPPPKDYHLQNPGKNALPRPIARARWDPNAANFGDTQSIWQGLPDTWKAELSGFPQSAVSDYLYLLKVAQDNRRRTGKNGMVQVDGKPMDPIDGAQYVLSKMRQVAQQIDTNYINAKNAVEGKKTAQQNYENAAAGNLPHIVPTRFGTR